LITMENSDNTSDNTNDWPSIYVFFMDVVGFSLEKGDKRQKGIVEEIISSLKSSDFYNRIEDKYVAMYGDGLLLVFPETQIKDPFDILDFSGWIQKRLGGKMINVRIGINCGNAFSIKDITGKKNFIGEAINDAQRVMDTGDERHILLHSRFYDRLNTLDPAKMKKGKFENLGAVIVKHGRNVNVYNYYGQGVGNKNLPRQAKKKRIVVNRIQDHLATILRHLEEYLKDDVKIDTDKAWLRISVLLYDKKEKVFFVSNFRYQHRYGDQKFSVPKITFKRNDNPVYNAYKNLESSILYLPDPGTAEKEEYVKCWTKEFVGIKPADVRRYNRPSSCYIYVPLFIDDSKKELADPVMRMGVMCVDSLVHIPKGEPVDQIVDYLEKEKMFLEYLLTILR